MMQRPGTDTGSPSLWWVKEEQTESMNILLLTGTGVSHNFGIPASNGNPVSYVEAGGNGNMFPVLAG